MQITKKAIRAAISDGLKISRNFILNADSYKTTHWKMYPKDTEAFFSYIEARKEHDFTIFAGLQYYVLKYLTIQITKEMIDDAEAFVSAHIAPGAFNRDDWDYLVEKHNGYLPVTIKAVKEGSKIPTRNVICTVECNDGKLHWLASYIETTLQRAIWYPTTVATNDYKTRSIIQRMLSLTSENPGVASFMLHDFGQRGVTCQEQAEIGGAAHTFNFMGSDTMAGVQAANIYYFDKMSAFSVYASEHSIACSYGDFAGEEEYLETMLSLAAPGNIISVVADAYDVYKFTDMVTNKYLDRVISSGSKIVIRPDSGDPLEVLAKVYDIIKKNLNKLDTVNKHGKLITRNSKGYMVLPKFLGVLQGDGVDMDAIQRILDLLMRHGWSSENIVFGSGGALLQKLNRDTYKFAQKGSAIKRDGKWIPIAKNPITDPGKVSKAGKLTLLKSHMNNEYLTTEDGQHDSEWEEMLETVYENGEIKRLQTLAEIRDIITKTF